MVMWCPLNAWLADQHRTLYATHLLQVIGRESEVQRVVQILGRKTKSSAVLLGEPGVGKSAVAEGVASAIASGALPGGSPLPRFLVCCAQLQHKFAVRQILICH